MNYESIEIAPDDIKIPERFRDDYGDISELASSISELGQKVPILVDRNNTLVDGHRRLLACKLLNCNVWAMRKPSDSFVDNKVDELVINLHRKDFTWREECDAVLILHEIMGSKKGQTSPGTRGGWKVKDTAKLIGKSVGYTQGSIDIAKWKKDDPETFEKFELKEEAKQYVETQKKKIKESTELEKEAKKLGFNSVEDMLKQIEKLKIPLPTDEKDAEKIRAKEKGRAGSIYWKIHLI
jgi:hypothetical protein